MNNPIQPQFRLLRFGEVRPRGWILEQMHRDLDGGFAGHLDELTEHASNDLFKDRVSAGDFQLQWWDSETRGNWLIGLTQMAYLANHARGKAIVDQALADLKATQDPDGYIGIYDRETRFSHKRGENGELWSQSRAMLALLSYYELTGDEDYLRAVERAAKLTMSQYGPDQPYFLVNQVSILTGLTHGLMYVDVMEWLYNITGDEAYREFGVWLYQDFCNAPGFFNNDDLKLEHLANHMLPMRGHAAHPAEHLRVLVWASVMSGDETMESGVGNAFAKLVRYLTPSGALIGDEDIHGLPMPDVGYEYCVIFELMNSVLSAAEKFGKPGFADWAENLAFNAAQGARLPDGTAVCYVSTENRMKALASTLDAYSADRYQFDPTLKGLWRGEPKYHWQQAGRHKYSPTHEDVAVCCNPNAVRLMPHFVSRMWMRTVDGQGLAVVLYGPSSVSTTINDVAVTVEMRTDYPFTESVELTIHPDRTVEFDLYLRKPAWATNVQIISEGANLRADAGYLVLRKAWQEGDEVSVSFIASTHIVENANGEYTVRRGPLQYAMPIGHHIKPIKDYPLPDFHDYDIVPRDVAEAYQVPLLSEAEDGHGCTFERVAEAGDRPWDQPPVRIRLGDHELVPLGCTVLRRSTLPIVPPMQ